MRDRCWSVRLLASLVTVAGLVAGCGPATVTSSPVATPTVTSSPVATPTVTSSPVATTTPTPSPGGGSPAAPDETGDAGDEPVGSETPAVGYTPGPTGALAPTSMARLPGEPDPALTPGSLNPAVTQANIGSTICKSGWTATVRPPASYTNGLKATQITQYGYKDKSLSSYEEDHLISLELGGNPTDPKNLWPEPYAITLTDGRQVGAHVKDAFETKLKTEVCAGKMTLAEAQVEVGDHWVHYEFPIP
jgi:hypothetical protein